MKLKDLIFRLAKIDRDLSQKSEKGHSHNDQYYTKSEIDAKINEIDLRYDVIKELS